QEFAGSHGGNGGSSGNSSKVFIPTSGELKARTIAEGGDRQSNTPGLIPRIHDRLLGVHSSDGGMAGRSHRKPAGMRERQAFMRGAGGAGGGLELCSTKGGAPEGGGRGASAEWRLCDRRTVHCTQRGLRGSGFSCGYRNIQMLCSALMEWPEYRRVLFGGSGCIPGIALLQCWIERAWADGYDPDGCEQLGGPGALMGSETWIGATECATLLRSFGVKAEVIDFESTAPQAPAEDEAHPGYHNGEEVTHSAMDVRGDGGDERDDNKRKTPVSFSSPYFSSSSSSNHFTSGGGGDAAAAAASSKSLRPIQQCICSFLPSSSTPSSSLAAVAEQQNTAEQVADDARRRSGAGQRLGSNGAGRSTNDGPAGRGGFGWGGGPGGRGGGRHGGGGRGGRRGRKKGRKNGSIGKDAGDRMGKALTEWAWRYFSTPWFTEEEDERVSSHGGGGDVRSSPPPSQPREPTRPGTEAAAPFALRHGSSNGMVGEIGGGSSRGGTQEKARVRPPPPLYFQHDGHSRSIVGVLLPEGGGAHATREGGNEGCEGRARGGGAGPGGGSVAGRGRGGGGGRKRQPGSLLVFDPSHGGREIRDALDDIQKARWGRLLKRGEHSFQRRHFQMVAVRAGLVEPGQKLAWKKIESVKVWVA
ncbi:unnamed protein product, partial [Hapterophycus canaliculatus]